MIRDYILQAQQGATDLLAELERGEGARELALAKTKLEEAELWLNRSEERHTATTDSAEDG